MVNKTAINFKAIYLPLFRNYLHPVIVLTFTYSYIIYGCLFFLCNVFNLAGICSLLRNLCAIRRSAADAAVISRLPGMGAPTNILRFS